MQKGHVVPGSLDEVVIGVTGSGLLSADIKLVNLGTQATITPSEYTDSSYSVTGPPVGQMLQLFIGGEVWLTGYGAN